MNNDDFVDPLVEEAEEEFPIIPVVPMAIKPARGKAGNAAGGVMLPLQFTQNQIKGVNQRRITRHNGGILGHYRMPRRLPKKTGEWTGRFEHEPDGSLKRDEDGRAILDRFAVASFDRQSDRIAARNERRFAPPNGPLTPETRTDRYIRQNGHNWLTDKQFRRLQKKRWSSLT